MSRSARGEEICVPGLEDLELLDHAAEHQRTIFQASIGGRCGYRAEAG